jgi:hypothetical protein
MFKGVLRQWPSHDLRTLETSRWFEIREYADRATGISGLWRDLDLNSFVPVGFADSFEQVHLVERFELQLKHLTQHVLASTGCVEKPW